jgi:hypothetical protein
LAFLTLTSHPNPPAPNKKYHCYSPAKAKVKNVPHNNVAILIVVNRFIDCSLHHCMSAEQCPFSSINYFSSNAMTWRNFKFKFGVDWIDFRSVIWINSGSILCGLCGSNYSNHSMIYGALKVRWSFGNSLAKNIESSLLFKPTPLHHSRIKLISMVIKEQSSQSN